MLTSMYASYIAIPLILNACMQEHRYKAAIMSSFTSDTDELSKVCSELWDLDDNRLTPGVDYCINEQGGQMMRV